MAERTLLILSRYGAKGASSRLRSFQYIPALELAGFKVTVSSFFDDDYLETLYNSRRRDKSHILRAYWRRIKALLMAHRYSVLWIEKETLPFLPSFFEAWLAARNVPYVVDYDDATFHTYDQHPSPWVRRLLGNKLDALLKGAQCVMVGNSYLESYVRQHGANRIERIPTVVDIERYSFLPEPVADELRIGWIGSPSTSKYLEVVRPVLEALAKRRAIRLVTIGAPALEDFQLPLEQHAWSEETEGMLLSSLHVGIMPLVDDPWERGKCGYKLIQYMACGRPVIASPVGMNVDIVNDDVGFLAGVEREWAMAFETLATDAEKRAQMGIKARQTVQNQYSLQVLSSKLITILEPIACVA